MEISDDFQRKIERLKNEPGISANPRLLARLLCGITSPRLNRAKMTGHELFGGLERAPFAEALRRVGQETGEGRGVSE
uniref:Uncharacterized protein n=1 Tax=Candidatus Kentrum sp. UNK TaxID=2126344 RepID=A0A451AET8_9GAMM|nr:MAG: hypothetical protein BECKUNK1418G_GA0071005_10479 [Candidatus Kentron sp. UNK]VFK71109.1 MAG: hypothetical protein BECKUNK1418H_GA0071006_10519 [Candidatus Kentron sp. UNK]